MGDYVASPEWYDGFDVLVSHGYPFHGPVLCDLRAGRPNQLIGQPSLNSDQQLLNADTPPSYVSSGEVLTPTGRDYYHTMLHQANYVYVLPGGEMLQGRIPTFLSSRSGAPAQTPCWHRYNGVPLAVMQDGVFYKGLYIASVTVHPDRSAIPLNHYTTCISPSDVSGLVSRYSVHLRGADGNELLRPDCMYSWQEIVGHNMPMTMLAATEDSGQSGEYAFLSIKPRAAGLQLDPTAPDLTRLYFMSHSPNIYAIEYNQGANLSLQAGPDVLAVKSTAGTPDLGSSVVTYGTTAVSASSAEGDVTRSSPDHVTITTEGGITTRSIEYHTKVEGALLEVFPRASRYRYPLERRYDAEYKFTGKHIMEDGNSDFYHIEYTVEYTAEVRDPSGRIVELSMLQELSLRSQNDSSHPRLENKIYRDSVLVAHDIEVPEIYDADWAILRSDTLMTRLATGGRAPWPGTEMRCAQYGQALAPDFFAEHWNPHIFSVCIGNNGAGTSVVYSVVETLNFDTNTPVTKNISDVHFLGPQGYYKKIDGFTETVEWGDARYPRERWRLRGYAGGRLRATFNPYGGAFHDPGPNNPAIEVNWR